MEFDLWEEDEVFMYRAGCTMREWEAVVDEERIGV